MAKTSGRLSLMAILATVTLVPSASAQELALTGQVAHSATEEKRRDSEKYRPPKAQVCRIRGGILFQPAEKK